MAPHFKRVVIYGVGLLGGSLGMAMRRRRMAEEIVGLGRSAKTLDRARQLGALDLMTTDLDAALGGADGLILCLPPRLIRKKMGEIAPLLKPGTFITDVGSVKENIVAEGEKQFGDPLRFIGSHPMAGSEKSGVEAARSDLFDGAPCFITPTPRTASDTLTMATQFWRAIGSRLVIMEPKRHDRLLATISHLPHLLAAVLVQTLYAGGDSTPLFRAVLGNGFRDTTRIAAGKPQMWEQIFSENEGALIENLDALIEILGRWRALLARNDSSSEIIRLLDEVSRLRLQLAPEDDGAGN